MRFRYLALLSIIALAACSGGGGSAPIPAPAPTASSSSGAITNPTLWPSSAKMSFSFSTKKSATAKKSPAYVSPSSTEVIITVNTVNGGAPPAWVPTPVTTALTVGGNCTLSGGTETCTVAAPAPPGTVNFTIATSDGTHTLSTYTGDQTIALDAANTLNITLNGIVDIASLSVYDPPAANTPSQQAVVLNFMDAAGNTIVSPGVYANPVTLTDTDTTGATTLSLNGATGASSVVVSSPSDAVTLQYTGLADNPFDIISSGLLVSSAAAGVQPDLFPIVLGGTTLDDPAHGGVVADPNYNQPTLFFAQTSGTQVLTASELGFTNAPYNMQFAVTLSPSCASSNIGSITSGPATSFTVTATGATGVCSGQVTESGTGFPLSLHSADGTFWISVTSASIGINHTKLHH